MWKYTTTDELYHYGVLGMRWGHRKAEYYTNKIKKVSKQRNEAYAKKGAISNSFRKKSKQLYLLKAKQLYNQSKLNGTKADRMATKEFVKEAKYIKRNGTANMMGTRSIYGEKPTQNEMTSINIKENRLSRRKEVGKQAARIALITVGSIGVTTAVTELMYKQKNGKFGIPSLGFINGQLSVFVK